MDIHHQRGGLDHQRAGLGIDDIALADIFVGTHLPVDVIAADIGALGGCGGVVDGRVEPVLLQLPVDEAVHRLGRFGVWPGNQARIGERRVAIAVGSRLVIDREVEVGPLRLEVDGRFRCLLGFQEVHPGPFQQGSGAFGLRPVLVVHQPAECHVGRFDLVAKADHQLLGSASLAAVLDFVRVQGAVDVVLGNAPAGVGLAVGIGNHHPAFVGVEAEADGQVIDDLAFANHGSEGGIGRVGLELPVNALAVGEFQAADQVVGTVQVAQQNVDGDLVAVLVDKAGGFEDHVVEGLIVGIKEHFLVVVAIGHHILGAHILDLLGGDASEVFAGVGRGDAAGSGAGGVGLVEGENAVGSFASQHPGMVQRTVHTHAGTLQSNLCAYYGGIGILGDRGSVGGLDPDHTLAHIDDRPAIPGGVASLAGEGVVDQAHVARGVDVQVAVLEQDRRLDIHRAAVVVLVGAFVGADLADIAAGDQGQALAGGNVLGHDRGVDVDAVAGFDTHIVVGQGVDDRLGADVGAVVDIGDVRHVRIEQPQAGLLAAGGVDYCIAGDVQGVARGFDHATLDPTFGAGLAGKAGSAVGPGHYLAAFAGAVGAQLRALVNGGAGGRRAALALEAAADCNRTALALGAAGIDLGSRCHADFVAQYLDVAAIAAPGRQSAADVCVVGIAQHDGATLVADRVGDYRATDADHRIQVLGGALCAHGHDTVAHIDVPGVVDATFQ
ncbi:hypothetical protein D3C80_675910 [compost metagenome]